ncbi:MAG: tetratricopeptide repeat protein [Methylococcales bacterium]
MEIYDTEEEQVAAIKRWWKANGITAIIGIIAGILVVTGMNYWQGQQKEKAIQVSSLFDELWISINDKKQDSAEKITERIMEQDATSTYATFSRLLLAKSKVQQGDLEAAKNILEQLMIEARSVELRNIARIRLIKILQANGENEQGLQLISEVDQATASGFSASYDELTGDLYVALDRLGEARTAYLSAIRTGAKSPLLQFKMDDIAPVKIINRDPAAGLIKE